jgi:hypothetical protein
MILVILIDESAKTWENDEEKRGMVLYLWDAQNNHGRRARGCQRKSLEPPLVMKRSIVMSLAKVGERSPRGG